jgi:ribosomal protein S18 acetylase RimI-like enzyme
MTVTRLTAGQLIASVGELSELLTDTVNGGASIGFLAPLDHGAAADWWRGRAAAVEDGLLAVWAAYAAGRIVGTVSLAFPDKPNSRHRAELVKLMVHRDGRGQGIGRTLLATAEHAAAAAGVTLINLDTETGSPAESLYRSAGWTRAGIIPDYARTPSGVLHPTTIFYKYVAADRPAGTAEPALSS